MTGLYSFADYYDIPALRRTIISELAIGYRKPFAIAALAVELPSSSPLYRFFVDTYVPHERFSGTHYERLTKEFLYLMYRGVINKSGDKPCRCCHNPCDYHEHDDEEEWENSESYPVDWDALDLSFQTACHLIDPDMPKPDPSTYRKKPKGRYGI